MNDDWKRWIDALHADLVQRDDPAEWVTEADAVEASLSYPDIALRGPVFGVAAQDPAAGPEWRTVKPVVDGMPQQARDALHSYLWFKAKDDVDDPVRRRELLATVAVLEREPVDEVEVLGVRYRVVRGDEFARIGADGLEPPRPTDRETLHRSWEGKEGKEGKEDKRKETDFVFDPERDGGPMAGAMKIALRTFTYTGSRFPAEVRRDSERAVTTHPDIVMLPVGFGVAERDGESWTPHGSLQPTPHEARRLLYDALSGTWSLIYRFDELTRAQYAEAAEEFRAAGNANEARVAGRQFRIVRIERLVRHGADGPESPRPTDTIHYDEE